MRPEELVFTSIIDFYCLEIVGCLDTGDMTALKVRPSPLLEKIFFISFLPPGVMCFLLLKLTGDPAWSFNEESSYD